MVEHVAAAHGLTAEVEWEPGLPLTVNDPAEVERAERVVGEVAGPGRYVTMPQPLSRRGGLLLRPAAGAGRIPVRGGDPPRRGPGDRPVQPRREGPVRRLAVLPLGGAVLAGLALDRLAEG